MRRPTVLVAAAVLATGGLASGCGASVDIGSAPGCGRTDTSSVDMLILFAQSVPTASKLPCTNSVLPGWDLGRVDVRDGRAQFVMANDRAGDRAVTVVLTASCDIGGTTPVPTDLVGTLRYERVRDIAHGYSGDRHYVFPGGCVTYHFRLRGRTYSIPVTEATLALGLVDRSVVAGEVARRSGGHLQLDPAERAGR